MRLTAFILITCAVCSHRASSQGWEQVYPAWPYDAIHCLLHWNGDTLLAGGNDGTLLLSADAGSTWDEVHGIPADGHIIGMSKVGRRAFLSTRPAGEAPGDSIAGFCAVDPSSGQLFQYYVPLSSPPLEPAEFIFIRATQAYIYFVESHAGGSVLHRSGDGGSSWERVTLPGKCVFLQPITDDVLIASLEDADSYRWLIRSTDAGATWNATGNLKLESPRVIAGTASDASGMFCLLGSGWDMWSSIDTGRTWQQTPPVPWDEQRWSSVEGLVCTGRDSWYISSFDGDIYRTTDGGATWKHTKYPAVRLYEQLWSRSGLVHCPPNVLVGGTTEPHLFRSSNLGDDWAFVRTGEIRLFKSLTFFSPQQGIALCETFDGSDALFATWDGGISWVKTGTLPAGDFFMPAFDDIRA